MASLTVYNTLTRQKEAFNPYEPGKVNLYACGVTVYDRCHLGHARYLVGMDIIVRFLRASGFDVHFVRNITDIDDKIIDRANREGISIESLTSESIRLMDEDLNPLGLLKPNQEPRATAFIAPMIQLIEQLIQRGLAYVSEDGDVCFEVEKFPSYGKLSHQDLAGLLAGARIEVNASKRSPLDFVLWKKAKVGEPAWPSPWGEGRPGWHIECSAMSTSLLGNLDIHGGGMDLKFPHHENEIAQSEGASGHCLAKYWLHVGLLQINQEKMAKSTGNFLTIESVLKSYPGEVLRYFLLSSHYRSMLNYSEEALTQAGKSLTRLYQSLRSEESPGSTVVFPHGQMSTEWTDRFFSAMNDDFNTPQALSVLFDLSRELNKSAHPTLAATLRYLGGILGLLQSNPEAFLQAGVQQRDGQWVEQLIVEREAARVAQNFKRADEIRAQLLEQGVVLEDGAEGTSWRLIV